MSLRTPEQLDDNLLEVAIHYSEGGFRTKIEALQYINLKPTTKNYKRLNHLLETHFGIYTNERKSK